MTQPNQRGRGGACRYAYCRAWLVFSAVIVCALTGCTTNGGRGDGPPLPMPPVGSGAPSSAPDNAAQLETFVRQAAGVVQARGREAVEVFAASDGPWQRDGAFLFVLDQTGRALRHGGAPHAVSRSMSVLVDMEGRPYGHWQFAAAGNEAGTAWSFYKSPRPRTLDSVWVASYAQRVRTPDDQTWVVGAGMYELPVDENLLSRMSAAARDHLQADAETTLRQIRMETGPFVYQSARIVVTDAMGRALAAPSSEQPPRTPEAATQPGRNGALPAALSQWVRSAEPGWTEMRWPTDASDAGDATDTQWQAHARQVNLDNNSYIIIALAPVR